MVPPHVGQMRGLIVGIGIEAVIADHNLSFIRLPNDWITAMMPGLRCLCFGLPQSKYLSTTSWIIGLRRLKCLSNRFSYSRRNNSK